MTMKIIGIGGLGLGFGLTFTLSGACVQTRLADHCANLDGDADCARRYPDGDRPYCVLGSCEMENLDGCYAARPTDDACYSPCGEDKSLEEDPDCEGVAETGTSGPTTSVTMTEPTATTDDPTLTTSMSASETETASSETEVTSETESTTGPTGCVSSIECTDPGSPVCVDEVCSPCNAAADGDAACEAKDPTAPACRDDGECVQCTSANVGACGDVTPVCDDGSSSCVGCTYHEQCAAGACRIATGACFDEAEVYDVGEGQTYETIDEAVTAQGEGAQVVLVLHAGASFDEVLTLSGAGTAYAFVSTDVPAPQWVNTSGFGATLRVEDDAEAYVQNVRLTANTATDSAAVVADGARVYLDRASVVNNDGGGIALVGGAYGRVRNCFVGGNVPDVVAFGIDGSSADLLYSTLVAADQFGDGAALSCAADEAPIVRNSVLAMIGAPSEIQCDSANVTYSASETLQNGTGNVMLPSVMPAWFESLTDDFHLDMPPAAIATAAQWQTGDPLVDIDGEPRPNVDDATDIAGADVP